MCLQFNKLYLKIMGSLHCSLRWRLVSTKFEIHLDCPRLSLVLQVERLSAVHGKHLLPSEVRANATPLAQLFCTAGMVGL